MSVTGVPGAGAGRIRGAPQGYGAGRPRPACIVAGIGAGAGDPRSLGRRC